MNDRRHGHPLRVLHCPTAVAGNAGALARAERQVGLDSKAVVLEGDPFRFGGVEVMAPSGAGRLTRERNRFRLMFRALRWADVVHFNFGRSIMPPPSGVEPQLWPHPLRGLYSRLLCMRDLPVLRAAGKPLVVTFQGDDARQGDVAAQFDVSPVAYVDDTYYTTYSDHAKRKAIRRWDRYADRLYALNPDLLRVLPERASFLPYASVDPREWECVGPGTGDRPLVLHAPTHRGVKGTSLVLDAVEQLRDEGVEFEFRLVEGLPHHEARRLYRDADILVDQLLVGWYGALAVELMAMGKPVVCYLRDEDLAFLDPAMRRDLPLVRADPTSVTDVLRELLTGPRERLRTLGQQGRQYVERWHDPLAIARRLRDEYTEIVANTSVRRRGA